MKLAIIGATGKVGNVMLEVIQEMNLPFSKLLLVASDKSIGKKVDFQGSSYPIIGIEEALEERPSIAIFSAGGSTSKQWAPEFAKIGTTVIDNSSAWRMKKDVKLVVPEINASFLESSDKIIANPNCSTIQMVLALLPLHKKYGIKRLVISTYQSVSGTGVKAVKQLVSERKGEKVEMAYPYPIDLNCLPHGGDFNDDGYTTEEQKLVDETRKILNDQDIAITATVVRVPVFGGHSESVNVELNTDFNLDDIRPLLAQTPGVKVVDNPDVNLYPMPLFAEGKNDVFVGRIRRDFSQANSLNMWIVSDNLRKGAATNAVQIAEHLIQHKLVN